MGFWIFLMVCNMLIPVTMVCFGNKFLHHPPKDINDIYGYRTTMSRKNMDTWKFAHACCGKLWKQWGIVLTVVTFIASAAAFPLDEDGQGTVSIILVTVQTAVMVLTLIPVEKALKKNFDKNGKRRTKLDL